MRRFLVLATLLTGSAYAGALVVEVSSAEGNAEAKSLHAAVVADVSKTCHEPAKSVVSAFVIRENSGALQRVPLQVIPLTKAGTFAIIGEVPPASVIDLSAANPIYGGYQPHVLIRSDERGMQWTSVKHFWKVPPTDADVRALL